MPRIFKRQPAKSFKQKAKSIVTLDEKGKIQIEHYVATGSYYFDLLPSTLCNEILLSYISYNPYAATPIVTLSKLMITDDTIRSAFITNTVKLKYRHVSCYHCHEILYDKYDYAFALCEYGHIKHNINDYVCADCIEKTVHRIMPQLIRWHRHDCTDCIYIKKMYIKDGKIRSTVHCNMLTEKYI